MMGFVMSVIGKWSKVVVFALEPAFYYPFFTMPALQIWPCHVTQEANFEKNYFFLILHLILGKVTKFLVEKLSTSEVISQKPHGGGGGRWKTPAVLLGLSFPM